MLGIGSGLAYFAALAIGYPLVYLFRRRGRSLAWSCPVSGLIAGITVGLMVSLFLLYAAAPARFLSEASLTAFYGGVGGAIGAGLGLVSGAVLFLMLRFPSREEATRQAP